MLIWFLVAGSSFAFLDNMNSVGHEVSRNWGSVLFLEILFNLLGMIYLHLLAMPFLTACLSLPLLLLGANFRW
ncbi:hypothetical protein OIU74_008479 [Salix koriyanagi]|uniref:Uncharacterized protein n=1 Tax=Salix koriyanagi TaxID=2511006 RepID=A0A9Q0TQ70_9ROSI|nr:hypothetical protein OIU74_008479 [Salix koriyanagi]